MDTTIQQVAAAAGVSRSTANMILTGRGKHYADKTCDRVMSAAKQLNYRPNISAQSLRNRRSYLIGAVYNQLNAEYLSDFTTGFQDAVTRNGCAPIVFMVEDIEAELKALQILSDRRVDGVLVNPLPMRDDDRGVQRIRQMHEAKVPVLEIFGRTLSPYIHSVNTDAYRAGFDVTMAMIEQGCEHPMLFDPEAFSADNPRTIWNWFGWDYGRGYHDAVKEAGLEPNAVYYDWQAARDNPAQTVAGMLAEQSFDGMIALAPAILREVIFAINQSSERVPGHFTIGGYAGAINSQPFCRTKVAVHYAIRESAEQAADQLFNLIEGKEAHDLLLGPKMQVISPADPR
jgi:LacI family transcriptional regulator